MLLSGRSPGAPPPPLWRPPRGDRAARKQTNFTRKPYHRNSRNPPGTNPRTPGGWPRRRRRSPPKSHDKDKKKCRTPILSEPRVAEDREESGPNRGVTGKVDPESLHAVVGDFLSFLAVFTGEGFDVPLVPDPLDHPHFPELLPDPHHVRLVGPVLCVDIDDLPLVP